MGEYVAASSFQEDKRRIHAIADRMWASMEDLKDEYGRLGADTLVAQQLEFAMDHLEKAVQRASAAGYYAERQDLPRP